MKLTRRTFLKTVAAASGAAWLDPVRRRASALQFQKRALPPPQESGIDHVVVVMMENRSFDHQLGWLPSADGRQAGLTYLDQSGLPHETYPLAPDFTGCGHPDPTHGYDGGRIQLDGGAMDGFLRSPPNDLYAIGYYVECDRPFYSGMARNFTALDRYFCSILGPTFPNRFFMHAAMTDRLENTFDLATMPTIWDSLADAGVSGRYYHDGVLAYLSLWGPDRYRDITYPSDMFFADAASGNLPAVAFVDPNFTLLDDRPGNANDDHPHADIRAGEAFLGRIYRALTQSPQWRNTVLVVNYDEWGGFFDHVAPPRADAPDPKHPVDMDLVDGKALLGFRVPTVVVSPFTRGDPKNPRVNSTVFDHTSVLKMIEWRWGLDPLTGRDASDDIGNLAEAMDFDNPQPDVPDLPVIDPPPPVYCTPPGSSASSETCFGRLARSELFKDWVKRGQ